MQSSQIDALIRVDPKGFVLRSAAPPAIVTRCTKKSPRGRLVGMVAARHVDPMLDRVSKTLDIALMPSWKAAPSVLPKGERATCKLEDGKGAALPFEIVKSTRSLDANLAEVDRAVGILAIIAAAFAFLVSVVLARTISRPLAVLAQEAGKVAADKRAADPDPRLGRGPHARDRVRQDAEGPRRHAASPRGRVRASPRGARSRGASPTR